MGRAGARGRDVVQLGGVYATQTVHDQTHAVAVVEAHVAVDDSTVHCLQVR